MSNLVKMDATLFTFAAAAVAVYNSNDLSLDSFRGLVIVTDIVTTGGATLTVKLQGKDMASGKYYDLTGCTTAGLASVATSYLMVYPGITVVANASVSTTVPNTCRVVATVTTASLTLAAIGASFLV